MLLNKLTLAKLLTGKSLSLTQDEVSVSLMPDNWNKNSVSGALASGTLQNKRLENLVFSADKLILPGVNGQFRYLVVHIGNDLVGYKDVGLVTAETQDVQVSAEGLITFATAG